MNKKPLFLKNHNCWPKWLRKPGLVLLTMVFVLPGFKAMGTAITDESAHPIDHFNMQPTTQVIKGTVRDNTGEPLPGATVSIKGKTVGTITDIDGKYQLNASVGDILIYNFIGMQPQEVTFTGQEDINISLKPQDVEVKEVVVTALGIKREKKALGYAVQDIKAEELMAGNDTQVASALQGKVAGVNISQSGAGIGGSSRIEIRGASSMSDNNSPLWVIDGIPFDDTQKGEASIWGGVERAGSAFDLNANDIESISVLKGANAAALYGSRAGNGVILVTTKKGTRGKGLGIDYSGGVNISTIAYTLDLQDQYGQGNNGVYNPNGTMAWGPRLDGSSVLSWTGETIPYSADTDKLKEFTRTGVSHNHSVAFNGGNDQGSFRASVGKDINNGIYEGHKIERTNFDFRSDYDVNNWLNIDTKFAYFLTEGENRPEMGAYSYVSYFNNMPINIRSSDLKPGYVIRNGKHVETLYTTTNANYRNPYFMINQMKNNDERYRTFGYLATNIKFTNALKLKLKYGLDYYRQAIQSKYLYGDNVNANRPDYNTSEEFFREENSEFLLSYNKKAGDFDFSINAGGNRMVRYSKTLQSHSGLLPDEGYYFLGYGTNITSEEDIREEEVQSIYGFGQVGYKNYLFLDITARNDWSSTLPADNNSYFYPSLSLSGVVSDMTELPQWISFLKLRTSWAQVGKAADPYSTSQVYKIEKGDFNQLKGKVPEIMVNKNLKPELSTSTEAGIDARLFNNRIGLDFTYYNERTKNQILQIETDQSTGYSYKLINAGLIINSGFEMMLKTTPVKMTDFTLDVDFNFAKNKTTVDRLDGFLKEYSFGSINSGVELVGIEGEKMGDIKGTTYVYHANGKLVVDADGLPIKSSKKEVIGNIQPDWTGSAMISAKYKNLSFNALVSIQQGGDIFSATEQLAVAAGTADRTTMNNRMSFFVDGVTADGGKNNEIVSAQAYWTAVSKIDEAFIYDASHMKLKEISLGYSLPSRLLNRLPQSFIKNVRMSLVGRNLFYFYKNTPGTIPDGSAYSSAYAAQAFDFSPVPATRTYGFSLNVGF
ncbi:MAG: SusC/RagA family TonB-linked outer membrane protein [Breznakibacter sp.]